MSFRAAAIHVLLLLSTPFVNGVRLEEGPGKRSLTPRRGAKASNGAAKHKASTAVQVTDDQRPTCQWACLVAPGNTGGAQDLTDDQRGIAAKCSRNVGEDGIAFDLCFAEITGQEGVDWVAVGKQQEIETCLTPSDLQQMRGVPFVEPFGKVPLSEEDFHAMASMMKGKLWPTQQWAAINDGKGPTPEHTRWFTKYFGGIQSMPAPLLPEERSSIIIRSLGSQCSDGTSAVELMKSTPHARGRSLIMKEGTSSSGEDKFTWEGTLPDGAPCLGSIGSSTGMVVARAQGRIIDRYAKVESVSTLDSHGQWVITPCRGRINANGEVMNSSHPGWWTGNFDMFNPIPDFVFDPTLGHGNAGEGVHTAAHAVANAGDGVHHVSNAVAAAHHVAHAGAGLGQGVEAVHHGVHAAHHLAAGASGTAECFAALGQVAHCICTAAHGLAHCVGGCLHVAASLGN